MNGGKVFVDTNLFVYLYSDTYPSEKETVRQIINQCKRTVSTQVLSEFCSVCTRKLKFPLDVVLNAVTEIEKTCDVIDLDYETVISSLVYHEKYKFSYYDCLMIASALKAECQCLLSEDMSDGQLIEGRLMIKNIFK